jgi:hypothetical protein
MIFLFFHYTHAWRIIRETRKAVAKMFEFDAGSRSEESGWGLPRGMMVVRSHLNDKYISRAREISTSTMEMNLPSLVSLSGTEGSDGLEVLVYHVEASRISQICTC